MATEIGTVITRLVALSAAITGINTASDGYPAENISDAQLPYIVVNEGPAQYTINIRGDKWLETAIYQLDVLVTRYTTMKDDMDMSGKQASRSQINTVVKAFQTNPRLALSATDSGLAFVQFATVTGRTQPGAVDHKESEYWGAAVTLSIEIIHTK